MASGHALVSLMPSQYQSRELKVDIVGYDSSNVLQVSVQSLTDWNAGNLYLVGYPVPRLNLTSEVYLIDTIDVRADISLLLSERGHFNHLIDVHTGPGVIYRGLIPAPASRSSSSSSGGVEQLFSEGYFDWYFSETPVFGHLYIQHNFRYPHPIHYSILDVPNADWNVFTNIQYDISSMSLAFANRDQSGSERVSGRLSGTYDLRSAPSSW